MSDFDSAGKQHLFLKAYDKCGAIFMACKIAGVDRRDYREWAKNSEFRDRLRKSQMRFLKAIEAKSVEYGGRDRRSMFELLTGGRADSQ